MTRGTRKQQAGTFVLITLIALGCRSVGVEGNSTSFSVDNYSRARALVERSMETLGGNSALEFVDLAADYTGGSFARGQSVSPGPPWDALPISGVVAYDSAGRVYREEQFINGGGTDRSYRRAFAGDGGWTYWTARALLFELQPNDVSFLRSRPSQNPLETFPHSILRRAQRARSSLRLLGASRIGSLDYSWIAFTESDGRIISVAIDEATGFPRRVERLGADPLEGDVVNGVEYDEYRPVGGVFVPGEVTFTLNESPIRNWSLTNVRVNEGIDHYLLPPGDIEYSGHPAPFAPQPVGEGVYAVRLYSGPTNGYNIGIVVFDDFVVVLEAPLVDAFYVPITRIVNAVAPGKPIKYLVSTHAHSDHIGGVRAFLAAGVDVVTTPSAARVLARMAGVQSTLGRNPLSGSLSSGNVVTVEDSMVISDGSRSLHVLQVGPTPHVSEILLSYLPAEGIVYVADLFAIPENRVFPPASETFRRFGEIVQQRGLRVEKIIPTHGLIGTGDDLAEALSGG